MKKRLFVIAVVVALTFVSYLTFTTVDPQTSIAATAAAKTYSGTVYVAGMGGHFAKADVTIDPSAAEPIKIDALDKIDIGDKSTHPTHDARIDNKNRNLLYWSTYKLDPQGKMHVGKTDLKTGNVIMDVAMDPDPRATGGEKKMPLYCASGQNNKYIMPVFMGTEGYVDVIDKASMKLKHRVFVSDLGYKKGTYKFVHGINSPDMKTFLVAINQAKEGKGTGDVDFILVDMKALEKGKFKEIKRNTLKGEPDKTITFREFFSNDGKLIYQSAGDRLWVINAKTLQLVDEKMMPEGSQIHDAMTTPDDKFALLTVRSVTEGLDIEGKTLEGVEITDGTFKLYDATAKKLHDGETSTCLACHKGMGLGDKNAILCGLDTNWKK